jgi:hypothetical protein
LQSNWVAHIAIKGQSLSQSGIGVFFGQQGTSSGIAVAASSTITACAVGQANAGPAAGANS